MTEPLDLTSSFRNVGSKGKNLNATMEGNNQRNPDCGTFYKKTWWTP
jgi:hypothetical protein